MSAGNPRVNIRLHRDELDQVESAIALRNRSKTGEPWNISDWIRQAIRDKLAHGRRRLDEPVLTLHRKLLGHLAPAELKELIRLLDKARGPMSDANE